MKTGKTRIILIDFVQNICKENITQRHDGHFHKSVANNHMNNTTIDSQQFYDTQELFQLLCLKMRSLSGIGFRYVATIGEGLLSCPWAVTVSHSAQMIFVGDYNNCRILGFNLFSRVLQETIKLESPPLSICVEKNYDGKGNDALIYGTSMNGVVKIRIGKIKVLWRYVCGGYPTGLCVSYANTKGLNLIFVCDTASESIVILNSKDGSIVNSISNVQFEKNNPFKKPFAIDFDDLNKSLYVSDMNGYCLRTISFKKPIGLNSLEYSQKSFGRGGTSFCNLKLPRGISMSMRKKLIFVCDESNHRIQVFDCKKEEFVNSFGSCGNTNSQFKKPYGIYFDDVLGLLFVADTYNSRLQLFQ